MQQEKTFYITNPYSDRTQPEAIKTGREKRREKRKAKRSMKRRMIELGIKL